MSRRWLLSLLCLPAAVVFVQPTSANSVLRVNESATQFLIHDQTIVLKALSKEHNFRTRCLTLRRHVWSFSPDSPTGLHIDKETFHVSQEFPEQSNHSLPMHCRLELDDWQ